MAKRAGARRQWRSDVMIHWTRVQYLSRSATRDVVMRKLAEHRVSRWPVLDPDTHAPTGYLLMKDMIVLSPRDSAWTGLIRPLQVVMGHLAAEYTRPVSKLPSRRFSARDFMRQKRCVTRVDLDNR
jgi:hypothetical protein